MRRILGAVVAAALVWAGWWALGAWAIRQGVEGWLAERRAEGWQAEARLSVRGFPARWRLRLDAPALADPETGIAWEAPWLLLEAPAWNPFAATLTFPGRQVLATPEERVTLDSAGMTAALALVPGPAFEIDRAEIALDEVLLAAASGWSGALAAGRLRTERIGDRPLAHRLTFTAEGLQPSRAAKDRLDPSGRLPREVARLALDATVAFDAPWDRRALESRRPQPTAIALDDLAASWGGMALAAAGALEVDPRGVPTGQITVRAENWREMLGLAVASGAVPEGLAGGAERALGFLAGITGRPDTIDMPLNFANGGVAAGPVPLGPAPLLRLR